MRRVCLVSHTTCGLLVVGHLQRSAVEQGNSFGQELELCTRDHRLPNHVRKSETYVHVAACMASHVPLGSSEPWLRATRPALHQPLMMRGVVRHDSDEMSLAAGKSIMATDLRSQRCALEKECGMDRERAWAFGVNMSDCFPSAPTR